MSEKANDAERTREFLRAFVNCDGAIDSQARREMGEYLRQMRLDGYSFSRIAEAFGLCGVDVQPGQISALLDNFFRESLLDLIHTADEVDRQCAVCPLRGLNLQDGKGDDSLTQGATETVAEQVVEQADVQEIVSHPLVATQPNDDTFRCLPLPPNARTLERRAGVPDFVYAEQLLEHPAVSGLMLSLAERLHWDDLMFVDDNGAIRKETTQERNFRIKWQKPVPMSIGSTSENFIKMDHTLFKRRDV